MKIIMIYDQIQSGAGIKDDHDIPLGAKKRKLLVRQFMMEPVFKESRWKSRGMSLLWRRDVSKKS